MKNLLQTIGITALTVFITTFIILGLFPDNLQLIISHVTGYLTFVIAVIVLFANLVDSKLTFWQKFTVSLGSGLMIVAYFGYLLGIVPTSNVSFSIICDCGTSALLLSSILLKKD